jgi:hypothetical protein
VISGVARGLYTRRGRETLESVFQYLYCTQSFGRVTVPRFGDIFFSQLAVAINVYVESVYVPT